MRIVECPIPYVCALISRDSGYMCGNKEVRVSSLHQFFGLDKFVLLLVQAFFLLHLIKTYDRLQIKIRLGNQYLGIIFVQNLPVDFYLHPFRLAQIILG